MSSGGRSVRIGTDLAFLRFYLADAGCGADVRWGPPKQPRADPAIRECQSRDIYYVDNRTAKRRNISSGYRHHSESTASITTRESRISIFWVIESPSPKPEDLMRRHDLGLLGEAVMISQHIPVGFSGTRFSRPPRFASATKSGSPFKQQAQPKPHRQGP